jgi:hypothetical protein
LSEFVLCQLPGNYSAVLSAALIVKCAEKSLWPDSEFVARQLDGIGPKYSENLVAAGKTTFQGITESNPRDLERVNLQSIIMLSAKIMPITKIFATDHGSWYLKRKRLY